MIAEPINCHSGDSLFELSRVAWAIHTAWSYLIRGLPQTSVRDMNFQDRMFPYSLYCSIQYKLIEQIAIFLSLFSLSLFLLLFFSFSLFMTSIFVSFDIHFSLVHYVRNNSTLVYTYYRSTAIFLWFRFHNLFHPKKKVM